MPNQRVKRTATSYRAVLVRAAIIAAASIGAVHADSYAQAARHVGCYDVHLGEWSPGPLPSDSIHYLPPTRITLTEEPGRGLGDRAHGYMLDPAPGAMPSIHTYSWWNTAGDSIILVWSTGFAGMVARVAGEDTLQGEARRFVDVVPATEYTVEIRLTPVDCGAPVPEERRKSHRFSPAVGLAGGLSLVLDSVPVSGLETKRLTEKSLLVDAAPMAPYDGADRVEVWLRADGTIRAIRLRYPSDLTSAVAVLTLRNRFGAPTSEPARPALTMWSSRLMYITVTESDGHVWVSLFSQRR
jgi:hypothetical protein